MKVRTARLVLRSPWTSRRDVTLADVACLMSALTPAVPEELASRHPDADVARLQRSGLLEDAEAKDPLWWRYNWQRPFELLRGVAEERRVLGVASEESDGGLAAGSWTHRDVALALGRRSQRRFTRKPVAAAHWLMLEDLLARASDKSSIMSYLVSQAIEGVPRGVYTITRAGLHLRAAPATTKRLARATHGQAWVHGTGGVIFFALRRPADFKMPAAGYFDELKHVGRLAQSALLLMTAQGLGGCVTPALDEQQTSELLDLPADCEPVYLLKFGNPR